MAAVGRWQAAARLERRVLRSGGAGALRWVAAGWPRADGVAPACSLTHLVAGRAGGRSTPARSWLAYPFTLFGHPPPSCPPRAWPSRGPDVPYTHSPGSPRSPPFHGHNRRRNCAEELRNCLSGRGRGEARGSNALTASPVYALSAPRRGGFRVWPPAAGSRPTPRAPSRTSGGGRRGRSARTAG
jgi:hypothetical protein